ncbi:MAG TPA: hypothetical protein VGG05_13470 [Pseudonocardiaceae bacterium]|jgi:hypothetical protein
MRTVTADRIEPATTATDRPPASRPVWLLPALAGLAALAVFWFARRTLIDDAYITLDYARNLAFHLHWGLIGGETANTATSPLNVLVLGVATAVTRQAVVALAVVYVLSTVAVEWGVRRAAVTAGLPAWSGLVAACLVAVDPLLVASIGMEVALGAGLVALLLAASAARRPVWFGVIAGLLVLTRADLLIVGLVVFFVRPGWRQGWWRSVLAAMVVTLPWFLWSWTVLGSAVPDTLIIKTRKRSWGPWDFGNGPVLYHGMFPSATVLAFVPAALGLLAALVWLVVRVTRPAGRAKRLDRFAALPLAGGLHYLAYVELGIAPYHWYYGTSIACFTLFLGAAVGAAWAPATAGALPRWSGFAAVTAAAAVLVACVVNDSAAERRGYAPITTNWASAAQYQRVGTDVGRLAGGRTVRSSGEIGEVAYYCRCAMIDPFSDRGQVLTMIRGIERHAGPVKRALLHGNFHFLDTTQRPTATALVLEYVSRPPHGALGWWPVSSPWLAGGHTRYLALLPHDR